MALDPSIFAQIKTPEVQNPLNALAQFSQIQAAQNQNALFPLQQQQMEVALQQAQNKMAWLKKYAELNQQGGAAVPNALTAGMQQTGQAGPTMAAGNALAGATQNLDGQRLNMLDQGAAAGVDTKDLFNILKYRMDGVKRDAGAYYKDPITGETKFYANPKDGITIDPTTNAVSNLPGAAASLAAITGANKGAEVAATNAGSAPNLNLTMGGRVVPGATLADQLRNMGGNTGMPAPQAAPQQMAPIPPGNGSGGPRDLPVTQMQSVIDDIKQRGDPNEMAQFRNATIQAINARITNPAQRASAIADFDSHIQAPHGTPIGGQPQVAQAPQYAPGQLGSGTSLDSATDTEIRKAQGLAGVRENTDPIIKFRTDLISKAHESNASTMAALHDTVRNEAELQNRNNQILPLLSKVETGGFDAEGRAHLANAIQTSGMMPAGLKDTLSKWIANGDPTALKVIENQTAAAGIKTMLDTLDKEGKPNRAIFDAVKKAQESVASGNATLKEVFGLQKQLYDWHYAQEQKMSGVMASPDYNPLTLQAQFSKERNSTLAAPTAASPQPAAKPTSAGPVKISSDADFAKLPSGAEFIAPDGSHRRKP